MTLYLALTLAVLGLTGGFFSGWLGIGGGIIMAPLLLYVPAAIGTGVLDMKVVAGLTVVQSLFATGSGVLAHRRTQHVSRPLVLWMGTGITAGSLAGALYSKYLVANVLLAIFAGLALLAAAMMLIPYREAEREPRAMDVAFNQPLALLLGLLLGSVSGLVGQSGAFIIIPAMLYILKSPARTTIGSSLGIVFLAASPAPSENGNQPDRLHHGAFLCQWRHGGRLAGKQPLGSHQTQTSAPGAGCADRGNGSAHGLGCGDGIIQAFQPMVLPLLRLMTRSGTLMDDPRRCSGPLPTPPRCRITQKQRTSAPELKIID